MMDIQKRYEYIIFQLDQRIEKLYNELSCVNKKIVIWGTGKSGKTVYEYCKQNNISIAYFGDNNKSIANLDIDGIQIKDISFFERNIQDYFVIICSNWENDIADQLSGKGISYTLEGWAISFKSIINEQYNTFDNNIELMPHSSNYFYFCDKAENYLTDEIKEKFELIKQSVADGYYKDMFDARVRLFTDGDISIISDYFSKEKEYFDYRFYNKKNVTSDECYVDCGAYTGDTIIDFIKVCSGSYDKIYGYEPGDDNYNVCKKATSEVYERIIVRQAAVGEGDGAGAFSGNVVSHDGIGDTTIVSLDKDIDVPVSWIKMDIEGYELKALKGAENLIKKYNPKLAICLYHCAPDIYEIPLYLKQIVPDYQFKFGQHFRGAWDFVLYADVY